MIKLRRMKSAGHVECMGERRGVYRALVGRPEGNRPLGRPRHKWENIKMDLQEVGWGYGLGSSGSRMGVWTGSSWLRIVSDGTHL